MLTLVKFGGSLITDKKMAYSVRIETMNRLVGEVKDAVHSNSGLQLILANGAGSFAHQSASLYGTENGFSDERGLFGYCAVHHDAARLNSMMIDICIAKELPVMSLQSSVMLRSNNKQTEYVDFSSVLVAVNAGIIPFLYGDAILDDTIGSTIYSTDRILNCLTEYIKKQKRMGVDRIIHVGDYDGVVDDSGATIPEITKKNYKTIKKHLYETPVVDVTGGMRDKVEEMLAVAKNGVSSCIISGNKEGNLRACLVGDDFVGTKIC